MFPPMCYCRRPFKWPPEPALLLKFLWELEKVTKKMPVRFFSAYLASFSESAVMLYSVYITVPGCCSFTVPVL